MSIAIIVGSSINGPWEDKAKANCDGVKDVISGAVAGLLRLRTISINVSLVDGVESIGRDKRVVRHGRVVVHAETAYMSRIG